MFAYFLRALLGAGGAKGQRGIATVVPVAAALLKYAVSTTALKPDGLA